MLEEIIGEEPVELYGDTEIEMDSENLEVSRAFCIDFDFPNRPVPVWG